MARALSLLRLSRPTVLMAGVLAFIVGAALAVHDGVSISVERLALGLLIFVAANASGHFVDEYADRDTDAMTRKTAFSGGSGVLPAGELRPATALLAGMVSAMTTILASVYLFAQHGLGAQNLLVLSLGLIAGWAYSLPPLALERRGWGELDNAMIGGYLMPLYAYTFLGGELAWEAFAALTPLTIAVFLNLLGVHWADREADASVGKRTLVVILSSRARYLHHLGVILLCLCYALLAFDLYPISLSLALACLLPLAAFASLDFGGRRTPYLSTVHMGLVMMVMIVFLLWR